MPLFIIPTPIGNLKDITLRALECLKSADLILCEDTRTSGILLSNYNISNPKKPFHQHNEHKVLDEVKVLLQANANIALISDAGTPGISDPGYSLIQLCIQEDFPFTVLPGATALIPALLLSGFPNHEFIYRGFLPLKKGRRTQWEKIAQEEKTQVFYESPHRIEKVIKEMQIYLQEDRMVAFVREISKMYEETLRCKVKELEEKTKMLKTKGEFVIVIAAL